MNESDNSDELRGNNSDMNNDTIAIIPARGGSKGIPQKNIKHLDGKPIISYTIEAALDSVEVDEIIVSTDDEEIGKVAADAGATVPFLRPAELAEDDTPTEPVITHAINSVDEEYQQLILLQPTSPLRTATHVTEAVQKYRSQDAKSLLSVVPTHSYRWVRTADGAEQVNYDGNRDRRQDKTPEYEENGAIYITDCESYLRTENLTVGQTLLYIMDEQASVDIDDPFDLWLAEQMIEYGRKRSTKQ